MLAHLSLPIRDNYHSLARYSKLHMRYTLECIIIIATCGSTSSRFSLQIVSLPPESAITGGHFPAIHAFEVRSDL